MKKDFQKLLIVARLVYFMKKCVMILFLLSLFLLPTVLAGSVDDELQKVTYYAEDYEIGNINYVQLMVYLSSVRGSLNEELGAVRKQEGGILKQEQIRGALGEPNEWTRWVWVEKEEREMKLDNEVPIWKKIVFDGKKIQIRLSAFPSLFKGDDKNLLVYRLNFQTEFQRPEEKLDIGGKVDNIQVLAELFNLDSSKENGEALASESVNLEKLFENYFQRTNEKCEDFMKSIFGSENQREKQNMLVNEIDFYDGDDVQATMRLEMCDECEWQWINLDMQLDSRGRFKMLEDVKDMGQESKMKYKNMDSEEIKSEVKKMVDEIRGFLEKGDYSSAVSYKNKLWMLNDAWNEKSNNIWEDVQKQMEPKRKVLENNKEQNRDDWRELEKLEKEMEQKLREENYQERKEFYLSLFEGYDKKEFYFEDISFEKRLVESFVDRGQEICDNLVDDNENGLSDCGDDQCAGKICGMIEVGFAEGNETNIGEKNLYCISGICQLRENMEKEKWSVCGNHICEDGENESCSKDCSNCKGWDAIECSGNVIFSGEDLNGCPLEPICIEEVESCESNDDCPRPLCGKTDCVENKCLVIELAECQEAECVDGQKKSKRCESGETVFDSICLDGMWREIDVSCSGGVSLICEGDCEIEGCADGVCTGGGVVIEDEIRTGCEVREDCGGVDDVCSNGKCVTLPKVMEVVEGDVSMDESGIDVAEEDEIGGQGDVGDVDRDVLEEAEGNVEEDEEIVEEVEEEESLEVSESGGITGGAIFNFFGSMLRGITGAVVDGGEETVVVESDVVIEEKSDEWVVRDESNLDDDFIEDESCPDAGSPPKLEDNCRYEKVYDDRGCVSSYDVECGEYESKDYEENRDGGDFKNNGMAENNEWEKERRGREKTCPDDCKKVCEEKLDGERYDVGRCNEQCINVCVDAGLKEFEDYFNEDNFRKMEKGVFVFGGQCRTAQQKTEGFVYFNGWGEPFEKIQPMKQKYYSGGEADWCKLDLENLKRQRKEIEKGFNQEFAVWFFEKYLVNSAEDWEQHVFGIFELYQSNVENQMEMAHRMQCVGLDDVGDVMDYKLINLSYSSEYGSFEYWEEVGEVEMPGMEGKVTIISPYMKVWIFPPREFIKYEMQKAMREHEFPGPPEEKAERGNEEGLTAEEREMVKQDKGFMKKIRSVVGKYGGNLDANVEFVEPATGEIVFNVYAQVNEGDILTMKPMLPEESDAEDVRIEIDFNKVYELIDMEEKEMRGAEVESPPWDKRPRKVGVVKNFVNGIKMYFKVRDIINSANVYPESAEKDAKDLFKTFFQMMTSGDKGDDKDGMEEDGREMGENPWEDKAVVTGEVVGNF
ncbi:MAG: hypothetical protein V1491_00450 [archaeon]